MTAPSGYRPGINHSESWCSFYHSTKCRRSSRPSTAAHVLKATSLYRDKHSHAGIQSQHLSTGSQACYHATTRYCNTDQLRWAWKFGVQWQLQCLRPRYDIHTVRRDDTGRSWPSAQLHRSTLSDWHCRVSVVRPSTTSLCHCAAPRQSSPSPRCWNGRTQHSRSVA